jgi:large subunit ribosomal protein L23
MNPYQIVKCRRVTEKSRVLENLHRAKSNRCLSRCDAPRLVFEVDFKANKTQIKQAIEKIFGEKNVKVTSVNTISIPAKRKRVRGFEGKTARLKKAVVTFRPGDQVEEQS